MAVLGELARGLGIRATARRHKIDKNTVLSLRRLGERHPRWFQLEFLAQEPAPSAEDGDRLYAFLSARTRRSRYHIRIRKPPQAL